ncbi:MAG: SRPBCC family protein [Thermomicrobiales bacterium]
MANVEKTITVDVPVRTAYDQWTQFEQFPRFMEGVQEVKQLDDKRLHWHANLGGKEERWDAEIVEQIPDRRISWRSTTGAENSGEISFEPAGANSTNLTARIGYDPSGFVESVGDKLGVVSRRVEGDLKRFKEFIESRGTETGAWRGEIHGGQVERDAGSAGIG